MNYRSLSALRLITLVLVREELRTVEVFLSASSKIIQLRFITARHVDLHQSILQKIRLAYLVFCCASTMSFISIFGLFLRNYVSIIESLLNCSFVWRVYIYLLELTNVTLDSTDLEDS